MIQKEDERTTDENIIIARGAKAIIMRYLYDAHSDWLREPSKLSTFHDGFMAHQNDC